MLLILAAMICAVAVATGQLLFKAGAMAQVDSGSLWALRPLMFITSAFALYFVASLGWVLILRKAPLGQIYPIMALSFVLVPYASYLFFGEQFSNWYFLGVAMIVFGIVLCLQS